MNLFGGFYAGRRVLLTGHTGFKGGWLALWLLEMGAEVAGVSLEPDTDPSLFRALGLESRLDHRIVDVRDHQALNQVFEAFRPDTVFHLAAQALVRPSYEAPKQTFDANVGGTVNVLECCRTCPTVDVVVCVTTDKCYENREWIWGYRENDPLGGHDPYSASKAAAEIAFGGYRASFFLPQGRPAAATVRAGNVIGGGDWCAERIVPDCMRAFGAGRDVVVRNPAAVRPWQHVLEPLSGYLWLGARLSRDGEQYGGAWNFAPADNGLPVRDLVDQVVALRGTGTWTDASQHQERAPHEAGTLRLCSDKARTLLPWSGCLSFAEAVAFTVEGYEPFLTGGLSRLATLYAQQIDRYATLARERGQLWAACS